MPVWPCCHDWSCIYPMVDSPAGCLALDFGDGYVMYTGMALHEACRRIDRRLSRCNPTDYGIGDFVHGGAMSEIWICRHPPTQSDGICVGQFPVSISVSWDDAVGRVVQSAPVVPTEIWTSDLPRCSKLAHLCAKHWNIPVHIDPRLREISMGEWQGKRYDTLQEHDKERWEAWCSDWKNAIPPNGENLSMLHRRVESWFVQNEFSSYPVLIAHAGVVRTLRVMGGMSWDEAMSTSVPHLTWDKIGVSHG